MINLSNFTALETLEMRERHLAEMRRLRLYHWGKVLAASRAREACVNRKVPRVAGISAAEYNRLVDEGAEVHQAAWGLHMGFVQALNALFPIGDTAERDAMLEAERHG